ncbi:MAG: hypothetical protein AAGI52_03400 [Bacteroidota bacterium]
MILIRSFFVLVLFLAVAACGGEDAPTDAEARIAEAEARVAEAEARAAEAEARAAAVTTDTDAPDTAATPVQEAESNPTPSGSSSDSSSSSTSTRPGLTGLPTATASATYTTLVDGTRPFRFCQTYQQTAVSRYQGMELCYTGTLRQDGTKIIGSGEKDSENGTALTGTRRTPFRIEGYLYDDLTLRFNFTDQGARRVSRGSASFPESGMMSSGEGHGWNSGGTFQTDAANSSGPSTFFIQQDSGV